MKAIERLKRIEEIYGKINGFMFMFLLVDFGWIMSDILNGGVDKTNALYHLFGFVLLSLVTISFVIARDIYKNMLDCFKNTKNNNGGNKR